MQTRLLTAHFFTGIVVVITLGVWSFHATGAGQEKEIDEHEATQFEYILRSMPLPPLDDDDTLTAQSAATLMSTLDEMGSAGWELAGVDRACNTYIFQRATSGTTKKSGDYGKK